MQIRDSDFFSQLACWAGAGSAPPALEELGELFADRRFNERRGVMHYLGDEPIDVSSLPTLELSDTVLFPDESATLTVSRTDPLLRLVELGDAVVQLGDAPPATIVKFRPGFGQPGEDDDVLDEVCTLGTISVTARYGPGEASLHVLTSARVIGDHGEDDPLWRNPAYPVFGACADFEELRDNFVKLIGESPGIDAVPGSNLLDTLEAIEQVGREYDRCRNKRPPNKPRGRDDGGNEAAERPMRFLDVAADFIAVSLIRGIPDMEVPVRLQQEWLEMLDPCARVRALNAFVVEALDDMMSPDRIYERALQARIERYERVLMDRGKDAPKERLRSGGDRFLKRKLGDARTQLTDPVARLRGKLDKCRMPRTVRAQLQPELLDRLSNKTDAKTMEYLRCLADLPWTGGKADTLDLEGARRVLDARHFGLRKAKERILEYLAVRRRKRDARGAVLCFVGPPGVGKSSLAASIAEALGRRIADVSCNGMRQASDVRGEHRAWGGAQPGRIIRQLQSVGARNPVFVLDELDKIGEVAGVALLAALDPTRNAAFHDHYLEVPFDLSEVLFIATANVLGRISTTLRSRLEVIEIGGYSEGEKVEIAKRILVPARIRDHGLTSGLIEFEDRALRMMIRDHAYEMGVRALDRAVSAFCRRVALRLETSSDRTPARVTVTESMVGEVLGGRTSSGEGLPDVERLRAVIELGDLPPEARRQGKRELEVLLASSPGDSDYNRSFAYLRWLAGLPWNARDEARIDTRRTRQLLDARHSGLAKAKERILEYLAARRLGGAEGSILCFIGPPGVGKTSLARSIADAMGRKLAAISCGGLSDETELRGHNRTWSGAQPGRVVRQLVEIGVKNPVLMLDEIDKMERTARSAGNAASALLEILDPAQNDRFVDHYVEVPFDLAEVFFVATANVREMIPVPLQDRLEVIELPGYSEDEKFEIAGSHLVGRQLAGNGLTAAQVRFTDGALHALIRGYTHEAGVRELERRIGAVCRKLALRRAEGDESPAEITERTVADLLGAPRCVDAVVSERMGRPGVAMGLMWTPAGGEVLFVEARRMRGRGALTRTGHLGKVMKESARAALSWVRANAARYGIAPEFYKKTDVHLHVPAGALPKDGPSAGVTMVAALVSELTGRTVRSDLAMTGEITLSGNVLPVGGIKEKVLAARRGGVVQVIVPKQNESKVNDDLGEDLQREIGVHYVSTIDEALDLALSPPAQAQEMNG